jgi:hypothetical protein
MNPGDDPITGDKVDLDNVGPAIVKVASSILVWVASIKLADVQVVVAIVSGLVVAGYAATQWFVLWRDKIRGAGK